MMQHARPFAFPALAAFVASTFVSAAPSRVAAATGDAAYAICSASASSTVAIEDCQKAALSRAEAALAAAFARALATLPPDRRAKLRAAETAWTAFRASDCGVFYGSDTGTIAGVRAGQCLVDRTRDRTRELADFRPLGN